uniref:Putative ovule protein n=1 Tax=Solanum chacoense TaxID=4108 RepID=A0A0V0GPS4_SOLCH
MIDYGFDLLVHGWWCDKYSSSTGLSTLLVFHVFKIQFQLASMEDKMQLQMMRHIHPIRSSAGLGSDLERTLIASNQALIHSAAT